MKLERFHTISECAEIAKPWNSLLLGRGDLIRAPDVSQCYEWIKVLWESRLHGAEQEIYVVSQEEEITGILPLHFSKQKIKGLPLRLMAPINLFYSGRGGFICSEPEAFPLADVLKRVNEDHRCDGYMFTVVADSLDEKLLVQACNQLGMKERLVLESQSPIIELSPWEEYFKSLPKKFRWLLRAMPKRLADKGHVRYEHVSQTKQLPDFMENILNIERASWKEEQGSSITANAHQVEFYSKFAELAAACNWLSGHVLFLEDRPIAYMYGIQFGGVFYDLKESYSNEFKDLSPGHILKTFALPKIIESGAVYYDFMGNAEPYKLKWTQTLYTHRTYILLRGFFKPTLFAVAAATTRLRDGVRGA